MAAVRRPHASAALRSLLPKQIPDNGATVFVVLAQRSFRNPSSFAAAAAKAPISGSGATVIVATLFSSALSCPSLRVLAGGKSGFGATSATHGRAARRTPRWRVRMVHAQPKAGQRYHAATMWRLLSVQPREPRRHVGAAVRRVEIAPGANRTPRSFRMMSSSLRVESRRQFPPHNTCRRRDASRRVSSGICFRSPSYSSAASREAYICRICLRASKLPRRKNSASVACAIDRVAYPWSCFYPAQTLNGRGGGDKSSPRVPERATLQAVDVNDE